MSHLTHVRRVATAAAFLCAAFSSVLATPTLRLSDGVNTVTIADGGEGDSSALAGVVSYSGPLGGSDFTFSITAGVTKPLSGSATNPRFTLNEVSVAGGSGLLIIDFSETDFGPLPATTLLTSIGGTTNGSVSYSLFADPSDQLFGLAHQITNQGPFIGNSGNGYSFGGAQGGGNAAGRLEAGTAFSLTQRVVIQRGAGPDDTGFTATVSAAPVPDGGSTVTFLGLGMVGVAGVIRVAGRRRQKTRSADGSNSGKPPVMRQGAALIRPI